MTITIMLEERLGADKNEVSSQVTAAIWSVFEQSNIRSQCLSIDISVELEDNPSFCPKPDKAIEKTEANSCAVRYLGGRWCVSDSTGDHGLYSICQVIAHINKNQLYIVNETIFTEECAKRLWYKV